MIKKFIKKIRQLGDVINNADALLSLKNRLAETETLRHFYKDYLLNTLDRYRNPKCLTKYGFRVYSQFDEDGIIERIFDLIGTGAKRFVEFGVENGFETNSTYLLLKGWSGCWIEANGGHVASIQSNFASLIEQGRLTIAKAFVRADTIQRLLEDMLGPLEAAPVDLLSIDIDGNDYWIWKSIDRLRPRLLVIEYNANFGPTAEWVMPYNPEHSFAGTRFFGASLKAFEKLGAEKGYRLTGCNFYGTNAFFVRDDLVDECFLEQSTSDRHYEPPRHHREYPSGWPKDPREASSLG